MNRKIIAYALFTAGALMGAFNASAQQAPGIKVEGSVKVQNPAIFQKYNKVWLYKGMGRDRRLVDSATVAADGSFRMLIKASKPALYTLDIVKWQTAAFWSDKDVKVDARGYDTSRVKIKNSGFVSVKSASSSSQLINLARYNEYLAAQEMDILVAENLAARQKAATDTSWIKYLQKDGLIRKKADFEYQRQKQLILANTTNPGVIYLLANLNAERDESFYQTQLNALIARFPALEEAKQLKKQYEEQLAIRMSLKKGSLIPHIAYSDPDGRTVDVNSFKGKYLLVDFWASWCGPCRKAIPEIKQLYQQYHDKGFEVLSVSVDTDGTAWRKAMAEEAMPWSQVISPDKNKTMREFMIIGIPTLFLVDREGKIVEKYTGFSSKLKSQIEALLSAM